MNEGRGPDIGVVIVAHGERGGLGTNEVLLGIRDRVAVAVTPVPVSAGVLSGEPDFGGALMAMAGKGCRAVLVYPFFMSDGYFVRNVVPSRIAGVGLTVPWRVLSPLGLDPRLPSLIDDVAARDAVAANWNAAECRLLVVGHGSKGSRASAEATCAIASAVSALGTFAAVEAAFLEEAPFAADRLREDLGRTIVVGLFSGEGLHGRDDIPELVAGAAGAVRYSGPIGATAGVADLIAAAIGCAVTRVFS